MAQKVLTTYVSDLSGKEITDNDAPTVSFAIDGTNYEIDLTDAEQDKFRKALSTYIMAGKKVTGTPGPRRASKASQSGPKASEVRAWAKEAGMDVPERGRIPVEITNAYEAAH